jgi:hypothetical protein
VNTNQSVGKEKENIESESTVQADDSPNATFIEPETESREMPLKDNTPIKLVDKKALTFKCTNCSTFTTTIARHFIVHLSQCCVSNTVSASTLKSDDEWSSQAYCWPAIEVGWGFAPIFVPYKFHKAFFIPSILANTILGCSH